MPDQQRKTCIDKLGGTFEVGRGTTEDFAAIAEMYDNFIPKAVTQGLPPSSPEARHAWLRDLLATSYSFLAWQEGRVVGHGALIQDPERGDAEYLIFVDQTRRNRGMGTQLTVVAVEAARDLGLKAVWLTVEALNFRAIKLYRKMGFAFCDACERERTMILGL